jgi:hypothetical protein
MARRRSAAYHSLINKRLRREVKNGLLQPSIPNTVAGDVIQTKGGLVVLRDSHRRPESARFDGAAMIEGAAR